MSVVQNSFVTCLSICLKLCPLSFGFWFPGAPQRRAEKYNSKKATLCIQGHNFPSAPQEGVTTQSVQVEDGGYNEANAGRENIDPFDSTSEGQVVQVQEEVSRGQEDFLYDMTTYN